MFFEDLLPIAVIVFARARMCRNFLQIMGDEGQFKYLGVQVFRLAQRDELAKN